MNLDYFCVRPRRACEAFIPTPCKKVGIKGGTYFARAGLPKHTVINAAEIWSDDHRRRLGALSSEVERGSERIR
jgi:hypothetical protein